MPLLFALAGILAIGLSFAVFAIPVLLVVGVVRAIRGGRRTRCAQPPSPVEVLAASPVDGQLADATFIDLIAREWPAEAPLL